MEKTMEKTISLLEGIYNTIQELEIKGEKNCSYITGISGAIKQHVQEMKEKGASENDTK